MDFIKYDGKDFDKSVASVDAEARQRNQELDEESAELDELNARMAALLAEVGVDAPVEKEDSENLVAEINSECERLLPLDANFKKDHRDLFLTPRDILFAFAFGGVAALIDYFIVRIPKDHVWHPGKPDEALQEGSPLTTLLRKIGTDENGNASGWVQTLEKLCKVPYDKSVNNSDMGINIPGLYPKTHRLQGLAHDPLFGIIFAIIDTINGTTTAIGTDGVIQIVKTGAAGSPGEILLSPLVWLGHLLSDICTKQGLPIPGWGALQALQIGSFGEKERTIAEISRYMYTQGYDLRHLITMAVPITAIELMMLLYGFLAFPKETAGASISIKEYEKIRINIKKSRMKFISYATAASGNAAKMAAYGMNPLAFNLPVWLGFIKQIISQAVILVRDSKSYEQAIENRYELDKNWEILLKNADSLSKF